MKQNTQTLRVVIVGHVDHGKSTLIGRLLHDTDSLPDGKMEEIEASCKARGVPFEWSFVLDAFQAERDQAVTIDTTQIRFQSEMRDCVIIDAPGHREFLKNMISGAAEADAAILVVDAAEGVQEQTRRHAYLLKMLGIEQIAVVINKIDKTNYSSENFDAVSKDVKDYLASIGLHASFVVPISAREGDMIARGSDKMDWYTGRNLIGVLDSFDPKAADMAAPLRFAVQDVYRFEEKRILVGRIETGSLKVGDTLFFSPTNEQAKVTSIESWPESEAPQEVRAGESVGVTLDQKIFVERGHIGSHTQNLPMLSNVFKAGLFWLSNKALSVGNSYTARIGTMVTKVTVQSIERVIDTESLASEEAAQVERNRMCEVTLRARQMIPIDPYMENARMGRVVLYDKDSLVGGGMISMQGCQDQRVSLTPKSENIFSVNYLVTQKMRQERYGHSGAVFWFTGLSGAGKSTLAMAVEKDLFERGYNTYVLDGDNVRHGLNSDLGFSAEDRTENIRRVGEVAALQADSGLVVLTAFISPFQVDRDRARGAAPERFHEIYIKADLETCESRDIKGLYKKARAGQIKDFTGIDSPYEAPDNPDLVVDTQNHDIETCVQQIVSYIEDHVSAGKGKEDGNIKPEKILSVSG